MSESNKNQRNEFSQGSGYQIQPSKPKDGEPNPFKFIIKRTIRSKNGQYVLAEINYPNCTNYKGNKILLLQMDMNVFLTIESIDPHFIEEGSNVEVLARFRPTKQGWELGKNFLAMIDPGLGR